MFNCTEIKNFYSMRNHFQLDIGRNKQIAGYLIQMLYITYLEPR